MKFSAATLLISSFASYVFAQSTFSITNPIQHTVAYAGQDFTITWAQLETAPTTITAISLWDGNAAALSSVTQNILTSSIAANSLSYTWSVPANLSVRDDYVLSMTDNTNTVSYSAYFSVQLPPTTAASATTTAASSASPVVSSVNGQRCIVG